MREESERPKVGKAAKWIIAMLVLAGMVIVSYVANVGEEIGIMGKLFILFLGAIIAIQLIPGMMLFGAMIKGITNMFDKKAKEPVKDDKY